MSNIGLTVQRQWVMSALKGKPSLAPLIELRRLQEQLCELEPFDYRENLFDLGNSKNDRRGST